MIREEQQEENQQEEMICEPGERIRQEPPELQLTNREKYWVVLGVLKSSLLIGCAYLIGGAVLIGLMLLVWM